MNKEIKSFKSSEAMTNEQKLIVEFRDNLLDVVMVFVNLNITEIENDKQLFRVLQCGALTFIDNHLSGLVHIMNSKGDKFIFLDECKTIFNMYVERLKNKIREEEQEEQK